MRAEAGHAYGAIGADIHVFGDGTPLYLLFEHRRVSGLDPQWLRAQPSRMLDARAEVVDFIGREAELDALTAWRDTGARFAVRLLHGEGGQGKTRLAAQFAARSQAAGWKVVDAVHGTDSHPPAAGSQDMRLTGYEGVLLLVDYADRWPLSDLSWMLGNQVLHGSVPARVLLIGRSADGWPALRGKLNRFRENVETSDQRLAPLPADGHSRHRMFAAAIECFGRTYAGSTDPHAIPAPRTLSHPDFALTLAVHMAALVAVDAAANGRRPPADMVGLTVYLLDREHENWRQLYENANGDLDFRTPDTVMARAVFTATLVGATDGRTARSVLNGLLPEVPAERILADHALCYPPTDPARANALEPLLPDRLAEDFLALSLPGSPITGYPTDGRTSTIASFLLHRNPGDAAPPWTRRAITFLAAAADRWPHVGTRHLYPVVRADPHLALEAGSAALAAVAGIGSADRVPSSRESGLDPGPDPHPDLLRVLEAMWAVIPQGRQVDLDIGVLAVAERLIAHYLATTDAPDMRARMYTALGSRRLAAGRARESLTAVEEAARLYRELVESNPGYLPGLANSLHNLGLGLFAEDRREEGLAAGREAVTIHRWLIRSDPARYRPALANSLLNLGTWLGGSNRLEEALDVTAEATELFVELLGQNHDGADNYLSETVQSMGNLGTCLLGLGRPEEALVPTRMSVGMLRLLAMEDPDVYLPALARALSNLSGTLCRLSVPEDALEPVEEAVTISRRLAKSNPTAFRFQLAVALRQLGERLSAVGRHDEAERAGEEAAAAAEEASPVEP